MTLNVSAKEVSPATSSDFALSNNKQLTIAAGSTTSTGTVTITAADNDVDAPNKSVIVSATASGGNGVDAPADQTLIIIDDDNTPTGTIILTLNPTSASEADAPTTVTVTATLPGTTTRNTNTVLAVQIGDIGDEATEGTDYATVDDITLTIAAGARIGTQSFSINPTQDTIDEGSGETVSVTGITTASGLSVTGTNFTITDDDDAPTGAIILTLNPISAREADDATTVTVTATLPGSTTRSENTVLTVQIGDTGDEATEGTDYANVDDLTLTIAAGTWTGIQSFSMDPTQDTIDEGSGETVSVTGTTTANGLSVTGTNFTITDDDDGPAVSLVLTPSSISENGGVSTVTATLSAASSEEVTLNVSAKEVSPATASDFTLSANKQLKIPAGTTTSTGTVTITAANNNVDTPNKTLTVSATVSGGHGISAPADQTLTITDDDDAPTGTITLALSPVSASEADDATTVIVTATLPGSTTRSENTVLTVQIGDTGDEATEGTDYANVDDLTLTIAAGARTGTQYFSMDPTQDTIDEGSGEIVSVTGTTTTSELSVTGTNFTITDDDDGPAVSLVLTPSSISENGGVSTVTATLSAASSEEVTLNVSAKEVSPATASDFTLSANKQLKIPAGTTTSTGTVTITAANNNVDTPNKTLTVSATVSGGHGISAPADQTLTITDDDDAPTGTITLALSPVSASEADDATTVIVTATLPGSTTRSENTVLTVQIGDTGDEATEGTDYANVDDLTLTIAAGARTGTQSFSMDPTQDTIDEGYSETVSVTGTTTTSGLSVTGTNFTITDDDNTKRVMVMAVPGSEMEDNGHVSVNVMLNQKHTMEVRMSYVTSEGTATMGQDFAMMSDTLVFAVGETSKTIRVPIMADDFDEDDESFMLTINNVENAMCPGMVTSMTVTNMIRDDDKRRVMVTPTKLTVEEGSSAMYEISLTSAPIGPVTIYPVVAGDTDVTVTPMSLEFTSDNWDEKQQLTVSAAEDTDMEDDQAILSHKASGGGYGEVAIADVTINVIDKSGPTDVSAWLARYSRTSANQLLSSVQNRIERIDRGGAGTEASIAGWNIIFGDSLAQPGMASPGTPALWNASQNYMTAFPSINEGGHRVRFRNSFGMASGLNAGASRFRNLTFHDALIRSAFEYAREMSSGNSFGVWGHGSFSRFGGNEADVSMDGDVMSATVGVDHSFSGWLHGLMLSRSESEGTYQIAGEDSLSLSASLTGVYPYTRYNLTDRLRMWATGGYGKGSLHLQRNSLASQASDISMVLGSIGMDGDIVSAVSQGFRLSWHTDAMLVRSSLESSKDLLAASTVVHRLRLALKSSYILRMNNRASIAPKVQLGVRQDGGDAEQGMGVDVSGGLGFIHSGWGLRAQVDMHGLVVHEDSNFEEWGVSGMILFDHSPSSDLGMSWRLISSWGPASSSTGSMRAILSRETISGPERADLFEDRSLHLKSQFDYGFAAFGEHGVASPYASVSVSGGETASPLTNAGVEIGGGLGYSNRSLGLRMRAGVHGLMSEQEARFEEWGISGVIFFDPDPTSPLGASFIASQSWGIAPQSGFRGSQAMGMRQTGTGTSASQPWGIAPQSGFGGSQAMGMRQTVTGTSRANLYGQRARAKGEMGYGFSASGGKGVALPYAGITYSDQNHSSLLLGIKLQTGRHFLLNLEGSTPENKAISLNSTPEFRARVLLKW